MTAVGRYLPKQVPNFAVFFVASVADSSRSVSGHNAPMAVVPAAPRRHSNADVRSSMVIAEQMSAAGRRQSLAIPMNERLLVAVGQSKAAVPDFVKDGRQRTGRFGGPTGQAYVRP